MATVYKAEHVHFREIRALKVIGADLASDETFVRRFTQEAVLTRRLRHPNAVHVDDIERAEDGRPFIVMEYIEGLGLKEVMQEQGSMPVARVCAIAKQVAAALDAAHRLGMVHRDIKPANIVLANTAAGELAKVLDFGIAKVKEAHLEDTRLRNLTLTVTGMVIGTPAYMSPEQAMGKRGDELDGRSDLYSLGVVIYQMLTGELPLKADSELQLLMAHIGTPPVPIRTLRPELQEGVASIVMRCLAKNREERPLSGNALIEEIDGWQKEQEIHEAARKKLEEERLARERAEAERLAKERAEQERLARERQQTARVAQRAEEDSKHFGEWARWSKRGA